MILKDLEVSLDAKGHLDFSRPGEEDPFLREKRSPRAFREGGRSLDARGGDHYKARVFFEAREGERFWGLEQHQCNAFDQKGLVVPLHQKNSQVTVPFMISHLQ